MKKKNMNKNVGQIPRLKKPLLLLAGATATGKTELAIELARRLNGEVISADSMQVYRGLVIGTAQPTEEDCGGVPYHLVNCVDPKDNWSVADWLRTASEIVEDINQRGKIAIFAGGTGLYFKTLTRGLFGTDGAEKDDHVRLKLEAEWDADGGKRLWDELTERDKETAAKLHPNDKLRVVRAHEIMRLANELPSVLQRRARKAFSPPPAVRVVLRMDRDILYERINRRVWKMMEKGFYEEVKGLVEKGATMQWPGMRALGYPQILKAIEGQLKIEDAVEETQKLSRRYAKQQFVLYRKWEKSTWLDASDELEYNASLIELMLELWEKSGSNH